MIVGAMLSRISMVKLQVAVLPDASVASYIIVVRPTLNSSPGTNSADREMPPCPQESTASGIFQKITREQISSEVY